MDKSEEPVGYKRPPKKHQWKRGQSGNPSGKKKADKPHLAFPKYLAEELQREVEFVENGETVRLPAIQLLARKAVVNGLKGGAKELSVVVNLLSSTGAIDLSARPCDEEPEEQPWLTEEVRRLLDFMEKEVGDES